MKFLIVDSSYDAEHISADDVTTEIDRVLRPMFGTVGIEETNLGIGADWPFFAVTVAAMAAGKQVREGLDAWQDLARRFSAAVRSLHAKFGAVRLDLEAARLVALDALPELSAGCVPEEVAHSASALVNYPDAPEGSLERSAYSIFTFTFVAPAQHHELAAGSGGECFVVVVSSDLQLLNVVRFPMRAHP